MTLVDYAENLDIMQNCYVKLIKDMNSIDIIRA